MNRAGMFMGGMLLLIVVGSIGYSTTMLKNREAHKAGITPAGDFSDGHMANVIEFSTAQLSVNDRAAMSHYLLSKANQP